MQSHSIEGAGGAVTSESIIEDMNKNDGKVGLIDNIYGMIHVFECRHLEASNDPNAATDLSRYSQSEVQEEFL